MPQNESVSEAVDALGELFTKGSAADIAWKLLYAALAAVIGLIAVKLLLKLTDRALARSRLDGTIKRLIRGGIKFLLLFVVIIVVMGSLGIPVTSLVAVLSVIGLALSLAVQNFLSNIAGGLQLLASAPFKPGDFVDAGGCSGTVTEVGLFYTKLDSPDNKLVQLPNSTIVSANIINYSARPNRRVDIKTSASYDAPIGAVKETLLRLAGEHPLVLADPAPEVRVDGYGDNAIQYIFRVWCANQDYWTVYYDLMDGVKPAFDGAGIEMTYPHLNVHMVDGEESNR